MLNVCELFLQSFYLMMEENLMRPAILIKLLPYLAAYELDIEARAFPVLDLTQTQNNWGNFTCRDLNQSTTEIWWKRVFGFQAHYYFKATVNKPFRLSRKTIGVLWLNVDDRYQEITEKKFRGIQITQQHKTLPC